MPGTEEQLRTEVLEPARIALTRASSASLLWL